MRSGREYEYVALFIYLFIYLLKFYLEQATKVQSGSRGIAILFH
jgi:hypothetical protein